MGDARRQLVHKCLLAEEVTRIQTDRPIQIHVERRGLTREVVVTNEDQTRLDAQRLDSSKTVREDAMRRTRCQQCLPQHLGTGLRDIDLVAELARIAGARKVATLNTSDRDRLRGEAEVLQ